MKTINKTYKKILSIAIPAFVVIILIVWGVLTEIKLRDSQELALNRLNTITKLESDLKNETDKFNSCEKDLSESKKTIEDKNKEITRLGGIVNEKDKAISTKNSQITNLNSNLQREKNVSEILANWAARFTVIAQNYNKYFNQYNNWVRQYLYMDNVDKAYLDGVVRNFNATVDQYWDLINEINP
jgi:septal ring factor EnvC (AmiA/AmiB activator)